MRGVVGFPQKTVPGNTTQLISIPQGQECQAQTQGGAEQLLNILFLQYSVQFSCSVVSDSMNRSTPGLPVHHQLQSPPKPMSIQSVMPSNHLIFCRCLLVLPSIFPSIRIFSNSVQFPILGIRILKSQASEY